MTKSNRKKFNSFIVIFIILAMLIPSILTGILLVVGG